MKGIDNSAYYRTMPGQEQYYMDYTGTGNSLNMRHPHVLQLIMDSLRYWHLVRTSRCRICASTWRFEPAKGCGCTRTQLSCSGR